MSATITTVDRAPRPATEPRVLQAPRPDQRRRPARPGAGTAPQARPTRPVVVPGSTEADDRARRVRLGRSGTRSCLGEPAPMPVVAPRAARWRLTDRGIALVLVVGAMVVVAAITVVGLTALRVTGDHQLPVSSYLSGQL